MDARGVVIAWQKAGDAKPPAKRVRGKKAAVDEPEETQDPEEEDQEEECIGTFARRYCPQRPWYKAKFVGIRDAFNARIRPFVATPCKYED